MDRAGKAYNLRDSEMVILVLETFEDGGQVRHKCLILAAAEGAIHPSGTVAVANEPPFGAWKDAYEEL